MTEQQVERISATDAALATCTGNPRSQPEPGKDMDESDLDVISPMEKTCCCTLLLCPTQHKQPSLVGDCLRLWCLRRPRQAAARSSHVYVQRVLRVRSLVRVRMEVAALGAAQWVVGKALATVADGVLEAWEASKNLGLNIDTLKTELLYVQVTLELASRKQLAGPAMEELLQKLRDSAHDSEDLLDELDYFRIHDELHGTYDAADEHAKGGVHNHAFNARHTAKAVGKLLVGTSARSSPASQRVSCCAWPRARQRAPGNSSSAPTATQADEEVRGCMPMFGKLLSCSSFPSVRDDDDSDQPTRKAPQIEHTQQTPMREFNRVHVSKRMKDIVEQMQPVRKDVTTILQICGPKIVSDIAQSRPITTARSIEPKFYGRDPIAKSIINDITKGKYCCKDLTALPIFGPGGIGKTTLIQQIYDNQEVRKHFNVVIWICVSLNFNLDKILEEIKTKIPRVEGEKEGTTEQIIEQRLKSRRFLLVLDDIWKFNNDDDWERLLLPLKTSQEMDSMILVTTRFQAIAQMVVKKNKTTKHSIELEGLETEDFRDLFHAFVFDDEKSRREYSDLHETGNKIMEKLKGNPLAAKTVGRLLGKDLSLRHWRRVLESKGWETQDGNNDIMPALKLSYDYLSFHQQQCFSYSALYPEDYRFSSRELIDLWIGLGILQTGRGNQTFQDMGLSTLKYLVAHGFFREEKNSGHPCYVMHDLLHDLALKVASHECLSLHSSNVRTVENQSCIRHLSIIFDGVGDDNAVSDKIFKSELRKLKTSLKIEHLQTLMVFGIIDESFVSILGDLFREANALRVLLLFKMSCPVESMLDNFSALIHLRYLCLGAYDEMHLPHTISTFYHLRILDLEPWNFCDFPKDMSNLAKLCRFYTPSDELHSDIYNVGKLKVLEELKVFRVSKESEGFEPKQLADLTELRELGIYNLEKIHRKEEAAEAKLAEKNSLERLTLEWDSKPRNSEPNVEAVVLKSLQPHRDLLVLCIRGHRGSSSPAWLGDELAVEALQSLGLLSVSWVILPSFGKMRELRELSLAHIATMKEFVVEQSFVRLVKLTLVGLESFEKWISPQDTHLFPLLQVLIIRDCPKLLELPFSNHIVCPPEQEGKTILFPKLQQLEIVKCPELLLTTPILWTETLCSVEIREVKLLEELVYSKSSNEVMNIAGKADLHSFDQVLIFSTLTKLKELTIWNCPPLELNHFVMLTSLKNLTAICVDGLFGPLGGQEDIEWQLPVEYISISESGISGKELSKFLAHLPRLSKLELYRCRNITQLVMEEDEVAAETSELTVEQEEDGVLLFPAHLSNSLLQLYIGSCLGLVLVDPPTLLPDAHDNKTGGGGGLQALRSLQRLTIRGSPKFLSACLFSSPSRHLFPSSLQYLDLSDLEGMRTLKPLSNLISLTCLIIRNCGEDLRCEGLLPLLTTGGHLDELYVIGSPGFFAGWDPRRVLQDEGGGGEQEQLLPHPPSSSTLRQLTSDAAAELLVAPICSFLSSSLTSLTIYGCTKEQIREMEFFTKEQEDALHLLVSLQNLCFWDYISLQHLPAGLHKLINLKGLLVWNCPGVRSLPKDGLPDSLQELNISGCGSEELKQQCRGLEGSIPKIKL